MSFTEISFDPGEIRYSETDEDRASSGPVLREGLFKTAITAVKVGQDEESNDIVFNLTLTVLDGNDQPVVKAPKLWKKVPAYVPNPKVPGHFPSEETKDAFKRFVQALDAKALPRGVRKEGGTFVDADGMPMTQDKWKTYNKTTARVLFDRASTWATSPDTLLGVSQYTFVKRNGIYSNAYYMAAEPGDKSVITENFTE